MNENFENNSKDNELRIVFEKKNEEYDELVSSIRFSKHKITNINNILSNFNSGIRNSKKFDKILYAIMGIIVGGTTAIGLLSSAGFSNILVGIGVLSLSIPFVSLIQSATYRLHVKKIINDFNNELSYYENALKEAENKLLEKRYDVSDRSYELADSYVVNNDNHMSLIFEKKLRKYEKPYIRVKKINN